MSKSSERGIHMKPGTKRILKKFMNINTTRMRATVDVIAKNSGHSKPYIYCSMAWNFIKYRMGYTDYFRGNFIEITEAEKKTHVTAKSFYNVIHYFNDQRYVGIFTNKLVFNKLFDSYLRRQWLNVQTATLQELQAFLERHPVVFAKDPYGECGRGISRIVTAEITDVEAFRQQLIENGQLLLEEAIIQCKELNEINPNVVNSFRVVTLIKDGQAYILNNSLRMNQGCNDVIGCSNDVYCSFSIDGRVDGNVVDDYGNIYDAHPLTGKKFAELQIPGMAEAFEMCKKAALEVPQMRYVGWDIAFSYKGPVMVEGNEYPGYGIFQYYLLKGSRTGHLEEIRQVVGDEIKNIKPA